MKDMISDHCIQQESIVSLVRGQSGGVLDADRQCETDAPYGTACTLVCRSLTEKTVTQDVEDLYHHRESDDSVVDANYIWCGTFPWHAALQERTYRLTGKTMTLTI